MRKPNHERHALCRTNLAGGPLSARAARNRLGGWPPSRPSAPAVTGRVGRKPRSRGRTRVRTVSLPSRRQPGRQCLRSLRRQSCPQSGIAYLWRGKKLGHVHIIARGAVTAVNGLAAAVENR
jgi:hypothetical protein